jgi:glycerol-3-phosphate dehydrogenase
MIKAMKKSTLVPSMPDSLNHAEDDEYDLLVVGGGSSGAGIALDAATRGLKVALVERDDFSAGASSKSTKLVHGGVRYLQKAIMELDYEQWKLVREALHERRIFLQTAPYLSSMLPIMLPVYKYWQLPYYWAGCKMYDLLAGRENMESSYAMGKGRALETFPMLKSDGLVGAIVYYDGQHNDSRMNVALIMTAVKYGAVVVNHTEVTKLNKNDKGKVCGARVKDNLTGEEWDVRAKGVINATGSFTDSLLSQDATQQGKAYTPIVAPSAGTHVTLPNYYSPRTMGLLDPATSDGRVIFFLPWQGITIAGTTDSPSEVEAEPKPKEDDVEWILQEVRSYLSPDINMIHVSETGLMTAAGGKWTTYRSMAQDCIDKAIEVFNLPKQPCITERVRLLGSDAWSPGMFIGLIQRFGLETEVAKHLADSYGDRAWTVCSLAQPTGKHWPLHGIRLDAMYPYIEAEVHYATRYEYAQTAVDFIARRSRLAFQNNRVAMEALPRIIDIMSAELEWDDARKKEEWVKCRMFMESMGLPKVERVLLEKEARQIFQGRSLARTLLDNLRLWTMLGPRTPQTPSGTGHSRAQFTPEELERLRQNFATLISQPHGKVARSDIVTLLQEVGLASDLNTAEAAALKVLVGSGSTEDVYLDQFLDICANLKESVLKSPQSVKERAIIPVEKSGGGV